MRDHPIQIMRVCAMIFIVFYHCLCFYGVWGFQHDVVYDNIEQWRYVCIVALTTFVYISGYLYATLKKNGGGYDKIPVLFRKKVNRLLVPYLAWGLLLMLILPDHTLFNLSTGISHLWFLLMMSCLFAIIIACGKWVLNPLVVIALIIVFMISNTVVSKFLGQVPNYMAWKLSIFYMPAFLTGMLTAVCSLPMKINAWKPGLFYSILGLTTILLIIESMPISLPHCGMFYYFPVYFWILLMYTLLRYKVKFGSENKLVSHFDKHSMSIYIIHHILIWVAIIYIPTVIPIMKQHYIIAPIIMFTIIFLLSWGLATLFSKNIVSNYLLTGRLMHRNGSKNQ